MCVKAASIIKTNNDQDYYTSWSPPVFDFSNPTKNDPDFASAEHIGSVSLQEEEGDCSNTSKDQQDLAMEDIHTTDDDVDEEGSINENNNSNSSKNRKNHKNKNGNKNSPTSRRRERVRGTGGGRHNHKCGGGTGATTMEQRTVVEHKYHDHYHDALSVVCAGNTISGSSSSNNNSDGNTTVTNCLLPKRPPGSARGGVTMAFPERLHEMLTTVGDEGLSHVISWQPHGRCFLIHKKSIFVEQIMPRFFHQSKLTSFQRQLNLYGFVRLTAGRDRGGYYHECFLHGRADLCRCMVRTRVKGNGMKAASSPDTEPNFYAMEPCEEHEPHTTTSTTGIMIENDNSIMSITESSTSSRRSSSSSSRACASAMFPSLEQAVAVELDEIYRGEETAVMLKARPEEQEDMMDVMEPDEGAAATGGGCCSSSSIMIPHDSFSSDFPMIMDLVSSMSFPSSSLAARVSPPESPNLNFKKTLITSSFHDIVESALSVADDFDMLLPSHLPHSGDAVFFEGLKFRYLDHLELVNNHVSGDDNNTQKEDSPGAIASV